MYRADGRILELQRSVKRAGRAMFYPLSLLLSSAGATDVDLRCSDFILPCYKVISLSSGLGLEDAGSPARTRQPWPPLNALKDTIDDTSTFRQCRRAAQWRIGADGCSTNISL